MQFKVPSTTTKDKSPVLCNGHIAYLISVLEPCELSSLLTTTGARAKTLAQESDSELRLDNSFSSVQESRTILYSHQFLCTYLTSILCANVDYSVDRIKCHCTLYYRLCKLIVCMASSSRGAVRWRNVAISRGLPFSKINPH